MALSWLVHVALNDIDPVPGGVRVYKDLYMRMFCGRVCIILFLMVIRRLKFARRRPSNIIFNTLNMALSRLSLDPASRFLTNGKQGGNRPKTWG